MKDEEKNIKYRSYIYSGIFTPFAILFFLIIPYIITVSLFEKWVSWVFIAFSLLLFVFSFKWINKQMFDIYFKENVIEIKYVLGKKTQVINYQDVKKYTFIETSRNSNNSLDTINQHFIFNKVVSHNQFIEFYKFLKSKNENIDIEISPLSSDLEYLRQKEFGLKYRKLLTETL